MNGTFYRVVVACMLLAMMGIITGLTSPGLADTDLGIVGTQVHLPVIISTTALYMLVLSRVFVDPRRFLSSSKSLSLCLPILLFCVASAAWSNEPLLSIRRSLFLVLTAIVGVVIGTDFELSELIRLLGIASLLHLALCVVFFIAAPHFLFSPQDPESLKGLTTHKNIFGFEQGIAVFAFFWFPFRRHVWLRWPLAGVAFVALLLSRSSGSLLATVAALACLPFLLVVRLRREERMPVAMIALAVLVSIGALLYANIELIPGLFAKDATLSGRTELWSVLFICIQQHLWLGYGFDSFWQGLQGDSLNVIRAVGWLVPTAHNGYLDLLLSGGVVGAALFLPPVLQSIQRALLYTGRSLQSNRFFPATLLVFWLIYNLNESALLTRSGLPFFLFVAISTSLAVRRNSGPELSFGPLAFGDLLDTDYTTSMKVLG